MDGEYEDDFEEDPMNVTSQTLKDEEAKY